MYFLKQKAKIIIVTLIYLSFSICCFIYPGIAMIVKDRKEDKVSGGKIAIYSYLLLSGFGLVALILHNAILDYAKLLF